MALDLREILGKKNKPSIKYCQKPVDYQIYQTIKSNINLSKAFSCFYVTYLPLLIMSVPPTSSKVTSEMAFNVHLCAVNSSNEKMLTHVYLRKLNEGSSSGRDQQFLIDGQGAPGP